LTSSHLREALELPRHIRSFNFPTAGVAELADALDSKSSDPRFLLINSDQMPHAFSLSKIGSFVMFSVNIEERPDDGRK
jgi:hypothetical protein